MFRILLLLLIPTAFLYSGQNIIPNIAISDFISQGVKQSEAGIVTEQLRAELHKTSKFRIVERSQMQEILKEQGFQQTGCTSDACAVEVGQLLGVRDIVVGTLGIAGSYTILSARIIDVQTGEVFVNETVRASGGIDKMIEGGIREIASKLVAGFSKAINEALFKSLAEWDLTKVENLLQRGADVDAKTGNGNTPLYFASEYGWSDAVKLLVKYGAYVNEKDSDGYAPISGAVAAGHVDLVELLAHLGADVKVKENDGETLLHIALKDSEKIDKVALIKVLVKLGADVNAKDTNGKSPLDLAADLCSIGIADTNAIKILIKLGADVNTKDNNGCTPLYEVTLHGKPEVAQIAKVLVRLGANVNAKNNIGATPLMYAVYKSNESLVELLIKCGANVNAKDNQGNTPLCFIQKYGSTEVVKILKRNGAK
jgi:ankyrin repeat protein